MEKIFEALINSGSFSIIDVILIAIIGILVYFVFIKNNNATAYMDDTIQGLKAQLDDEHKNVEKLSSTIYQIRRDFEAEREEKWNLREEVSLLRVENERLKLIVQQLEQMVETLKEENKKLLNQIQGGVINE